MPILYEKSQGPKIFLYLAAPSYFKKVVIFDGRVVKIETTGLVWSIFGHHWTAKVSIFDGRVVKNRGPWNSSALPALPPELNRAPQLGATHPHAPGARMT